MSHTTIQKIILRNRWLQLIAGTTFFVALVLLILPIASKLYLTKWLLGNGADTVVIEKIRMNPFTGAASLEGVHVTSNDATVLSKSKMVVNIGLMSLFKKQLLIEEKSLHDLTLDIELFEDGRMRFGSYTTGLPTHDTKAESQSTATPWILLAGQVTMSNCNVHLKMPELDMTLQVDEASLNNFSTAPGGSSGTFSLKGSINGTPVALDFNKLDIVPDFIVQGTVKIKDFELDNLADLLRPYLTPFTGRASVDGSVQFKLTETGDIFTDYDGLLSLEQGYIAGDTFSVQGAPVRWENGTVHFELSEKKGIIIDVDGSLTGKDLAVDIPDPVIKIREPDMAINGKVLVSIDDEVTVATCAGFTLKQTTFSMPPLLAEAANIRWQGKKDCVAFNSGTTDKKLSVQVHGELLAEHPSLIADQSDPSQLTVSGSSLSWQGNSILSQATDNSLRVMLEGDLKGTELKARLEETGWSFDQQSIAISAKGSVDVGQDTAIQGTASFMSNGFTLKDDHAKAPLVALEQFTIDTIEAPGGKKVSIKQATAKGLEVGIEGNMPLQITIPSIELTDIQTEDFAHFSAADVSIQSPVAVTTKNNKALAGLGTLNIQTIQAGLDRNVTAQRVNFDNLFFLEESTKDNNDICRIAGARLSKIGWNPEQGVQGESLSFADLHCTFIRDEDGNFTLNKELAAMSYPAKKKETPATKPKESDPGSKIRLGQVTLRGKSGLHFEDHTLEVPFISDLAITTLQVKNINSSTPHEPASIKMIGSVDKRAPLEISGTIAPFTEFPAVQMKMKLKNYPLANLSAYTVQSVGVALASGQLKLKSKLKLKENKLDMNNEILLTKLKTSTISKELAEKLDNQLPLPLDSALSMLRDSEDNINLDVPLNGSLDELNVGISDILITALSKAIVPAASGYLMYTLGPYGALAWVGMKVGERMLDIRLPPIEFTPGKSEISEKLKDYFDRLGKILQDKPETDFQLSPISSSWEFISESKKKTLAEKELELSDRDKKKLMELGQERARNIKDYLIRNYSIDKDRLLISITALETKKTTKPRVDIQM